ncbi:ABC transporter ATP-binding protein [Paenibacillus sp. FSL K6-1318]|uniref:ABC transporter ATP-binding protein n=1 Tax=Paenibacillus sp. FSL K6-1318 TaxID=2975291 RepID=UPI0030EC1110
MNVVDVTVDSVEEPLLDIRELVTRFHTPQGQVTSVDGLSMTLQKGEIVGVVGESGCGKSVTAQSVLRLFDEKREVEYEGEIRFSGTNLLQLSERQMQAVRGNDIAMIFQDPLSSLNPVYTIGDQIMEALQLHQKMDRRQARERVIALLKMTGISSPEQRVNQYPHQLSGGMRQRIMIAMALACRPKLLIADEPTTALDVTIQAQIMRLVVDICVQEQMGLMLITHDLGVVAESCHRVVVMYLGQIVETASVATLFKRPRHPYSIGLLQSLPRIDGDRKQNMPVIEGSVPSLHHIPSGCRFASRCAFADAKCHTDMPPLRQLADADSSVRCWYADTIPLQEVR